MKCEEIQKKLVAYVDDELDLVARNNIKHHLEECPQCRAQLEETKKMLGVYKSIPELKPEPGYRERIVAAIPPEKSTQKKLGLVSKLAEWFNTQNKVVRWAPAAATVLIILILAWTFVPGRFASKKKPLLERSATVYTYYEHVAKEKPNKAEPKFGRYSFISIY